MGDRLVRLTAAAALAVAATAGCGVGPSRNIGAGGPGGGNGNTGTITVYLASGTSLKPVVRPELPGHPYLGLSQLSVPVTSSERRQGLHTEVHQPLEARLIRVASQPEGEAVLVVDLSSAVPRQPV